MIEGVLFDLDGILVDTEPLHCRTYIKALANHGIHITEEFYFDFWTRQGKGIKEYVREYANGLDPLEVRDEKLELYFKALREDIPIIEGAPECLEALSAQFPLGLVTGSLQCSADLVLELTEFRRYFNGIVVTADDVTHQKPHPEALLLAAEKLKLAPSKIAYVGDAQKDFQAAHAAGMNCVAIPTTLTADNDFSLATTILSSIKELTPEYVRSL